MAEVISISTTEGATLDRKALRSLRTKKPFTRIVPWGHYDHGERIGSVREEAPVYDQMRRKIVTQEDFLRELDPAGHVINDREYYPDIWRQNTDESDKENYGKWYIQEVPRYAFAYQQVILNKQLTHLCGNDIQFELADKKDNDEHRELFNEFKRGWANKNMEVAWYKAAKSVKATGDGALVGYMDNGSFGWKVLSFLKGDRLYPHFDKRTGKLLCFAREFSDYDEDGVAVCDYLEVWDDTYYYRFSSGAKEDASLWDSIVSKVKSMFSADGYKCETVQRHNFPFIPVAYKRDDNGPCWTFSEETIENYEMAFSRLAQANHDFGLPIMYVKGEGSTELSKADMTHASKIFFLPSDGEIGFLNKQDASEAYNAELAVLEEQIYKQSFATKAPQLKSGDTPGVAVKLLYGDSYERGLIDCNEFDDFVDAMVNIFTYGYGVETKKQLDLNSLKIAHSIKIYIHLNENEQATILSQAVQNGYLSRQTASEKFVYSTPSEWDRILREKKEQQEMDLLLTAQKVEIQTDAQMELSATQTENQIAIQKAQVSTDNSDDNDGYQKARKINGKRGSVGTNGTRSGRPSTLGKSWDDNGNEIDPATGKAKSKWDKWNAEH